MKKFAIIIEKWKFKIFSNRLNNGGYKYDKFNGPVKGTLTLRVETNDLSALISPVRSMQNEASISKNKKYN